MHRDFIALQELYSGVRERCRVSPWVTLSNRECPHVFPRPQQVRGFFSRMVPHEHRIHHLPGAPGRISVHASNCCPGWNLLLPFTGIGASFQAFGQAPGR
jgi:hypothetical protein